MLTLNTGSYDPTYNLALEQALFETLPKGAEAFWLWQNHRAVIVGRHQHTEEEVNLPEAARQGVPVVRRLSGGGAVVHDLGNVNFTYIGDLPVDADARFTRWTRPILDALGSLGLSAQATGRNDLTLGGRKFSGNAQLVQNRRLLHHGTLLYDSDLASFAALLTPPKAKLAGHGVASVQSRVTNLRPHLSADLSLPGFIDALLSFLRRDLGLVPYALDHPLKQRVQTLQTQRYQSPGWNIGASPRYHRRREVRFAGGTLCAFLTLSGETIGSVRLCGDFFAKQPVEGLEKGLVGLPLEARALAEGVRTLRPQAYIVGLDAQTLMDVLLGQGTIAQR